MTKESSDKIVTLCESWWATLANSTRHDQHQFAEQFLGLLGWAGSEAAPIRVEWAHPSGTAYVLRGGAETAVAAHFVGPGLLDPPGSLVERGLDFCTTTRKLVSDTHAANIPYALITDLYRSYLYDVRGDELLLHADTPRDFDRELTPVLGKADVERGALEEVRRPPRSHAARQLREWCQRWCSQLCTEHPLLTEEAASAAIDRLLVTGFLLDHDVLKGGFCEVKKRWGELTALASGGRPGGSGQGLVRFFGELWNDWRADLFVPIPRLDETLLMDAVAAPMLKEFGLLSRSKLSIATILESFNYGDPAEKARVRMVPEANKERETYFAKQTAETISAARVELDIAYEGYRAIFYWFDKLVALYGRLETAFDAQAARQPASEDLDLLAWAELAAAKPRALSDKRAFAVESGLMIYYTTPRQLRIARLMLYLHLISRCHQANDRLVRFPDLRETFRSKPRLVDVDRKWSGRRASDTGDDAEAVSV
jgi:hypothetical protein